MRDGVQLRQSGWIAEHDRTERCSIQAALLVDDLSAVRHTNLVQRFSAGLDDLAR
jgi:hypothetical protein